MTPYVSVREHNNFFQRMEELDKSIAKLLNERHWKDAQRINTGRESPTPDQIGDWVWMLRPKGTHVSKLDTWWVGPAELIQRVSNMSYQIRVKPAVVQDVHMDQRKPYTGRGVDVVYHVTGYVPMETGDEE